MKKAQLPELFLERLRQIVPPSRWSSTLQTFQRPTPTTFRINTLKADPAEIKKNLQNQGFHIETAAWYPDACILRRGTLRELQQTEAYRNHQIYVQSLASMLPPLILKPEPEESVLDLTAAPGSKTTQMACQMQNRGSIVANDNNKIRFYRLKANVSNQGAEMVQCSLRYGESVGKQYPETFDRVLLDAPCSAEGRFQVSKPKSFQFWKMRKVYECVKKQRKLLLSAYHAVKPGGMIIYSTCTFAPEENEGVLNWFFEKCPDARISPIDALLPNFSSGLARWEGSDFASAVTLSVRVLPTQDMEAFFIAKICKPH